MFYPTEPRSSRVHRRKAELCDFRSSRRENKIVRNELTKLGDPVEPEVMRSQRVVLAAESS